jgi:hypothetical protein
MADERSYAERADGASTFDPEAQFDRDQDARAKPSHELSQQLDDAIQHEIDTPPQSIMRMWDVHDEPPDQSTEMVGMVLLVVLLFILTLGVTFIYHAITK